MQTTNVSPRFGAIHKLQNKEADQYIDAKLNFQKLVDEDQAFDREHFNEKGAKTLSSFSRIRRWEAFSAAYAAAKTGEINSITTLDTFLHSGFLIREVSNPSSDSKHQKDVFIFTGNEYSVLSGLEKQRFATRVWGDDEYKKDESPVEQVLEETDAKTINVIG